MYLRLGATAALTLMAATAAAQTTRVEAIAQEQATKARTLAPEGPNAAEQVVVRVMNSPLLSKGGGAYPWFGSVFGGSGFALGGGYLKRLPWDASANALVGISINNSKLLEARLQLPELWRGRLRVDAAARWTDAKDVSYFGVGVGSQLDDRDPYDYEPTELDTTVTLRPACRAYASAGYTRLDIRAEDADGDTMAPLAAPGVGADLGYHVTRAMAAIDWRPSPGYATRGGLYRVSWDRYDESTGQPFAFSSTEYEVRQLVPLVREQFVLAVRGLVTTDAGGRGPGRASDAGALPGQRLHAPRLRQSPLHRSPSRAAAGRVPVAAVALHGHGPLRRRRPGGRRDAPVQTGRFRDLLRHRPPRPRATDYRVPRGVGQEPRGMEVGLRGDADLLES